MNVLEREVPENINRLKDARAKIDQAIQLLEGVMPDAGNLIGKSQPIADAALLTQQAHQAARSSHGHIEDIHALVRGFEQNSRPRGDAR